MAEFKHEIVERIAVLSESVSNPEHFTPHVRVLETGVPEKRKPRFR